MRVGDVVSDEPLFSVDCLRVGQRHVEVITNRGKGLLRRSDDLIEFANQRSLRVGGSVVADQRVVVVPKPQRTARIGPESLLVPPGERVRHLPRTPCHKEKASVGELLAPEVEKQDSPWILPPPRPVIPAAFGYEIVGFGKVCIGESQRRVVDFISSWESPIRGEHPFVEFVERSVFEVATRIAVVRSHESAAYVEASTLAHGRDQGSSGAMHPSDHQHWSRCRGR